MYIQFNEYSKTIGKWKILKNINLRLESGKIYLLSGKNGSGKTMLMRAICGLIYPTAGTVEIDGKIVGKDMEFPESVGLLLENPAFINRYTGFYNLKMLASLKKTISDDEIRNTMERVGLVPDYKKVYRKYSLGMKQKLGIAAAIMEKPDLIILDEPTNALDEEGMKVFKAILEEEKARGALIVLASHEKETLAGLADETFTLDAGKLVKIEKRQGKRTIVINYSSDKQVKQ